VLPCILTQKSRIWRSDEPQTLGQDARRYHRNVLDEASSYLAWHATDRVAPLPLSGDCRQIRKGKGFLWCYMYRRSF